MPKPDKPLTTKMWPSRSQIFLGSCKQGKLWGHHFTGPQHESPCMAFCNATLLPLPPPTVTTSPIHCGFAALASRERSLFRVLEPFCAFVCFLEVLSMASWNRTLIVGCLVAWQRSTQLECGESVHWRQGAPLIDIKIPTMGN